jgi:hypothetical protein
MADVKFFELNGVDLTPYTLRIEDTQSADSGALDKLGTEFKDSLEKSPGTRKIIWSGNISNEADYLRFRKEVFGNQTKTAKLNPNRQIAIAGLDIKKVVDILKPENTKIEVTLLAADPREYNIIESSVEKTISASGTAIIVESNGEAPTTPEWIITATGTIINPVITDPKGDSIEWDGTLNPGDVLSYKEDGSVFLNNVIIEPVGGALISVSPGSTNFVYSDNSSSSHSCTLKATWRDAFY